MSRDEILRRLAVLDALVHDGVLKRIASLEDITVDNAEQLIRVEAELTYCIQRMREATDALEGLCQGIAVRRGAAEG